LQAVIRTLTPEVIALFADQQVTQAALTKGVSVPGANMRAILVENKDKAQQLEQQAQQGADFAELAKQNSLDAQSAATGGDLGTDYFGQFSQINDTYDALIFAGATPTGASGCYDHNAYTAAAGTVHYVSLPDGDQYLLFQVSDLRDRPLSEITDETTQGGILGIWLSNIVRRHASVATYLSVPVSQQPKLTGQPPAQP
jgi:hypothetical protein